MRKLFTMIAAMMMIASAATIFSGCKKEEPQAPAVGTTLEDAGAAADKAAADAAKAAEAMKKDLAE